MTKFKMRAECQTDLGKFLSEIPVNSFRAEQITFKGVALPDMVAEFTSPWELDAIKDAMAKIPDGHVMFETIAPFSEYTGERTFA